MPSKKGNNEKRQQVLELAHSLIEKSNDSTWVSKLHFSKVEAFGKLLGLQTK